MCDIIVGWTPTSKGATDVTSFRKLLRQAHEMTTTSENNATIANPFEAARFLRAFVECSRETQEIVLEMASIISDKNSTDDERTLACDAMFEALFPGTATDVLEKCRQQLRSPEAAEAAASLKTEGNGFANRVRALMAEKGITQENLATAAGIGQPAVSNILNRNCRPQRRTIARFADALGVSAEDLWPESKTSESGT